MMQAIEFVFPSELDENEVLALLGRPESGFDADDRGGLESMVVDGFTIAGVVLNAFSLGAAIWTLKAQLDQAAKDKKSEPKPIRVRRIRSTETRALPSGEVTQIVKTIEEVSGLDK